MRMLKRYWINSLWIILLASCAYTESKTIATIQSGDLELTINEKLFTTINSFKSNYNRLTNLAATEFLIGDELIDSFELKSYESSTFEDQIGSGTKHLFTGLHEKTSIEKHVEIAQYDSILDMLFFKTSFTNLSQKDVLIKEVKTNAYQILDQGDKPPFWTFQGSSSSARADWIKPIEAGYYQKNFMGMNNSDYGGGIPVTDIWRSDMGITIGHTAMTPKLISLPTELKKYDKNATISIQQDFEYPHYLSPGESIESLPTFVAIHSGDYYNGLKKYSEFMQRQGIHLPESEPAAFEPIWCAWGYGRKFNLQEVTNTLPKVKEFGIKWAVLDDGYQIAEGDWNLHPKKFPKGNAEMKAFVDKVHQEGLKAKLWWAPLAADPGSKILQEHPEARLYLEDWSPQHITWWDSYYLSPTHPATIEHTKKTVHMFIEDWGFDGLKLDGQHMNAIAPDHNPESGLQNPGQAPEHLPEFFQLIYNEALSLKPHAVVENCPCGTCMSYFNMPYMNQAVSSDPLSSWQIRHKGKTYKALIPNTAYYGDHVELSDNGNDFASSFGVGAVLGTKFVWPKANKISDEAIPALNAEDEKTWKKWFALYNQKMLSKAAYRGNLYDIGYDHPETHVIQKGDTLHYAFYADEWDDPIELRGLKDETYIVRDYVNDQIIGEVTASSNQIHPVFAGALLIEVYPKL